MRVAQHAVLGNADAPKTPFLRRRHCRRRKNGIWCAAVNPGLPSWAWGLAIFRQVESSAVDRGFRKAQPALARITAVSSGNSDSGDFVLDSAAVTSRWNRSQAVQWRKPIISLRSTCRSFCVETRGFALFVCHFGTGITGPWSLTP